MFTLIQDLINAMLLNKSAWSSYRFGRDRKISVAIKISSLLDNFMVYEIHFFLFMDSIYGKYSEKKYSFFSLRNGI